MRYLIILAVLWSNITYSADFEYLNGIYTPNGGFNTRKFIVNTIHSQIKETNNQDKAIKISIDAYSRTKKPLETIGLIDIKINKGIKKIEKFIFLHLPLEKNTVLFMGSAILMAREGKANTSLIKNLDISVPFGGKMRPDAEFDWRNMGVTTKIKIGWFF